MNSIQYKKPEDILRVDEDLPCCITHRVLSG